MTRDLGEERAFEKFLREKIFPVWQQTSSDVPIPSTYLRLLRKGFRGGWKARVRHLRVLDRQEWKEVLEDQNAKG